MYSDIEMLLKNYITLYNHSLQWFIGIMNNNEQSPPTRICFCWTEGQETMMAYNYIKYYYAHE